MDNEKQLQDNEPKQRRRSWQEWLISDSVLGSLVVFFTVATAFSAYRSSVAEIEGGDLDFNSQVSLTFATTAYLENSITVQQDQSIYQAYTLLLDRDPEAAEILLERASDSMKAGMERETGPFDEIYHEAQFSAAKGYLEEAQAYQEQGDVADDTANAFHSASLFLAVGLAITAWASLFNTRPRLRLIFTLLALPLLAIGLLLVGQEILG